MVEDYLMDRPLEVEEYFERQGQFDHSYTEWRGGGMMGGYEYTRDKLAEFKENFIQKYLYG